MSPREPATRPLRGHTAGLVDPAAGQSGDLFTGRPIARPAPARRRLAPELSAARVLCRQLARKQGVAEKQRIAHLICLNLRAILNRSAPRA
jgi:hypothetical protein